MPSAKNVIDKAGRLAREVAGTAEGIARHAGGTAKGIGSRTRPSKPKALDDVTITRKVETIVFRDEKAPKSTVSVNTADGVVYLRGTVKRPEQVKALEAAVRKVPEVQDVENLLHLPKTPAPTRADTPRKQQKTRRTNPRSASPRAAKKTERVNTDRTKAPAAEPTPKQTARSGKGRRAAPLGSTDKAS